MRGTWSHTDEWSEHFDWSNDRGMHALQLWIVRFLTEIHRERRWANALPKLRRYGQRQTIAVRWWNATHSERFTMRARSE